MPEVISNTSPLQYLFQCNQMELLRGMYGGIVVPSAVVDELDAGRRQGIFLPDLRAFSWVSVRQVAHVRRLPMTTDLGAGEIEVLSLAAAMNDALVLLDDGLARRYAQIHGIRFTGTCGVLLKAKQTGLVAEVKPLLEKMTGHGFFLDAATWQTVLRLAGEL